MWYLMTILGGACITNLWVHSEPGQWLRSKLRDSVIKRLLDCALCSGFWIGLIITFNPLTASVISVAAELISKKLTTGSI